jgi:small subunit ribosomal protein S1
MGINVTCGSKDLVIQIKKSQLAKEASNQRPTRFTPGQKCDVLITSIDIPARKVSLSIKALEDKEAKEIIKKFGSTESGGVLGDLLKPILKKKKSGKKD